MPRTAAIAAELHYESAILVEFFDAIICLIRNPGMIAGIDGDRHRTAELAGARALVPNLKRNAPRHRTPGRDRCPGRQPICAHRIECKRPYEAELAIALPQEPNFLITFALLSSCEMLQFSELIAHVLPAESKARPVGTRTLPVF